MAHFRIEKFKKKADRYFDDDANLSMQVGKTIVSPLYKFTCPHWTEEFFRTGSLRIGTLFEFHRKDLHGENRGDDLEGLFSFKDFSNRDISIAAQNQWMFCTSLDFTKIRMERFGGSGYRIDDFRFFVEMTKALEAKLGVGISEPILGQVNYIDRATKRYASHNHIFAGSVKERRIYKWQNEVRMIWETKPPRPLNHVMRPMTMDLKERYRPYVEEELERVKVQFINAPRAVPYCSRL